MESRDFIPNDNCWTGAETIKAEVDKNCSAAFIKVALGNNRISGERLLYMAYVGAYKVLKTAVTLAIGQKKEPRVGKIIEWMIASQASNYNRRREHYTVCDLDADGETIADAIKPAIGLISSGDWNRIIARTIVFADNNVEIVRKVLALFGKTVEREPDDAVAGKHYVIPGKYDTMPVVSVGGFYVMNKDLCSCCDYEEAKAIEKELAPYGWRLPSKDEAKTIEEATTRGFSWDGRKCYSDKLLDEKYDLAVGTYNWHDDSPWWQSEYKAKDGNHITVDPHVYDFFPCRDQLSRKYLGWCSWIHNGSIFTVPLTHGAKWVVPGRKFKDKKISVRLIRDPDLVVKDI